MTQLAAGADRTLALSDAIPDDHVVAYYVDDRKLRISVPRVDDRLLRIRRPVHLRRSGVPAVRGLLAGMTIVCQCHGSRFDITTRAVISGPAIAPLNVYEVHDLEGSIHIRA
jgi:3-phenylpropionate/trans-cinnamate dioxygenase ferredoxin component